MKKIKHKLVLRSETIRQLTNADMQHVAGGFLKNTHESCVTTSPTKNDTTCASACPSVSC